MVVIGDGGVEVKVDGGREAKRARAEPYLFTVCSSFFGELNGNTKNIIIHQ